MRPSWSAARTSAPNAGDLNKDLIVILNDNGMSIAPNVGALSSFFSRQFTRPTMVFLKKQVENLLGSLPAIGDDLLTFAKRSQDSLKAFFTPGMLFEALKFTYLGPVNGHWHLPRPSSARPIANRFAQPPDGTIPAFAAWPSIY